MANSKNWTPEKAHEYYLQHKEERRIRARRKRAEQKRRSRETVQDKRSRNLADEHA